MIERLTFAEDMLDRTPASRALRLPTLARLGLRLWDVPVDEVVQVQLPVTGHVTSDEAQMLLPTRPLAEVVADYQPRPARLTLGRPSLADRSRKHPRFGEFLLGIFPPQIADEHGDDVATTYTRLRAGEKLHEQLFAAAETGATLDHPLISHVAVPSIGWPRVRATIAHSNRHLPDALRDLAAIDSEHVTQVRQLTHRSDNT